MATKKERVTQGLWSIGACWAISSNRFCDANDDLESQIEGRRTYHVHPDASYPHQADIKRFDNLDEIAAWIAACKRALAAPTNEKAFEIMQEFWA